VAGALNTYFKRPLASAPRTTGTRGTRWPGTSRSTTHSRAARGLYRPRNLPLCRRELHPYYDI